MLTTYQKQAKLKLVTTVVALLVVAGLVFVADALKPKTSATTGFTAPVSSAATTPGAQSTNNTSSPSSQSSTDSSASSSSSTTTSSYKDGAYTASVDYFVPHGDERIQVSLTLSSGVISNVSVHNSESDPTSASYQEDFAAMYKSSVVGHKISGLQLGSVAGASDTTQAFDEALSQIASQAQA